MDLSHLDKKYFVDSETYNCPFCKRNNVPYDLVSTSVFDWNDSKQCYVYFIKCQSCRKTSLHWSWEEIRAVITKYASGTYSYHDYFDYEIEDLDVKFFFHQPTSFFTLDTRIPPMIRDLVTEAEKCRSANSLIGASACIRKAIYELLNIEHCIVHKGETPLTDYTASMEALETKFPTIDKELFTTIKQIRELSSDLLHEDSWAAWSSSDLVNLTELLKIILGEVYLREDEKKKITELALSLKEKLVNDKLKSKVAENKVKQ